MVGQIWRFLASHQSVLVSCVPVHYLESRNRTLTRLSLRFAWTSFPSVHWIVPIIASGFFGLGIYIVILSILNYVVDSYQTYSASALAGVILIRNLVGAGFPLFANQMYNKLGYEWASSLLAFLSILMIPIPWLWFYYGEKLRLKSPYAREHFAQDEDAPH